MENENIIQIEGTPESLPPTSQSSTHAGRHHSSRHSRKHSKKTKRKRIDRKTLRLVILLPLGILLALLLFSAVIAGISRLESSMEPYRNSTAASTGPADEEQVSLNISIFLEPQKLLGDLGLAYMNANADTDINRVISEHFADTAFTRQDRPLSVTVNFKLSGLPDGCVVRKSWAELSESVDFAQTTEQKTQEHQFVTFSNLKTGTTYYFQIHFLLSNRVTRTCSGYFSTAEGPRLLEIGGIANVRDIGGWKAANGQTIRQGLLYRGSELDGFTDPSLKLSSDGIDALLDRLGIRWDMDLRYSGTDSYILGDTVTHKYYDLALFDTDNKTAMQKIFRDLSNPDNYPVYLHCTDGVESTGTVCLILEALLGVSREDLIRDYELSALYTGSIDRADIGKVLSYLESYTGANLQQQAENYLLSCGVTEAEIASIRSIFLEEA